MFTWYSTDYYSFGVYDGITFGSKHIVAYLGLQTQSLKPEMQRFRTWVSDLRLAKQWPCATSGKSPQILGAAHLTAFMKWTQIISVCDRWYQNINYLVW